MKNLPMKAPRAGGDWETAGSTTPATRRKAPRAGGLGGCVWSARRGAAVGRRGE
jgi:hypothetical protein